MDRVELNGRPATAKDLGGLAFAGYGQFTSMQMRAHLVRGLDLHLERLARDSLELFGPACGVRACRRRLVRSISTTCRDSGPRC